MGAVLTPFDQYFVVIGSTFEHPGQVWERDALQGNASHRLNGSNTLPDIISICPVAQFVTDQALAPQNARVTNLGSAHAAGAATWHLRSKVTLGLGTSLTVRQTDLYINQKTHFVVRLGNEVRMQAATFSISTARFSKFDLPLSIQVPP